MARKRKCVGTLDYLLSQRRLVLLRHFIYAFFSQKAFNKAGTLAGGFGEIRLVCPKGAEAYHVLLSEGFVGVWVNIITLKWKEMNKRVQKSSGSELTPHTAAPFSILIGQKVVMRFL